MDTASNRALTIAVAVLVTIVITSGVLFSISQMQDIYKQVYETDVNIQNRFSEYEAYDNTIKTGLDVMNAAKKYRDSNLVKVIVGIKQINTSAEIALLNNTLGATPGEVLYNSSVVNNDGFVTITFTKK